MQTEVNTIESPALNRTSSMHAYPLTAIRQSLSQRRGLGHLTDFRDRASHDGWKIQELN